jgi:signal transduction histidine kinase
MAAEEALLRNERLAVSNRFAGAILHEINNPLEALTNLVFLTKLSSGDEAIVRNMEIAESQLERLRQITNRSLDFYRGDQQAREFDVIEIAESALTIHRQRIGQHKVELCKRFRSPARARVFPGEMLQVLSNLILNSLDALPEENARLHVRVRSCAARVHIIISDNGTGIDPAIVRTLFEANRTTKPRGTGFGLWVCKSILDKHSGTIACRTSRRSGRSGTNFRVTLPIDQAA